MGWQAEVDNLKSSAFACSLMQALACSVATTQHSYCSDTHLELAACACASACCACHSITGLTASGTPSAQLYEDNKALVGLQTAPLDFSGKRAVAMLLVHLLCRELLPTCRHHTCSRGGWPGSAHCGVARHVAAVGELRASVLLTDAGSDAGAAGRRGHGLRPLRVCATVSQPKRTAPAGPPQWQQAVLAATPAPHT